MVVVLAVVFVMRKSMATKNAATIQAAIQVRGCLALPPVTTKPYSLLISTLSQATRAPVVDAILVEPTTTTRPVGIVEKTEFSV